MEQQSLRTDDCIEKVVQYYSDMVYQLAFTRTGTRSDADDIFQEVFLRYVKKQPVFENEEHRKAWLIRVTINCSNSFSTSLWRTKIQKLTEELVFEDAESIDLHNELKKLPKKYWEVVHLFYYEDLSTNQIADILGRRKSTVRMQLTRARNLLKDFMTEEDYV